MICLVPKIISVFTFQTQNCYHRDWKLVKLLIPGFKTLRRIGILFCISQIPLHYFRCLVYNSFVYAVLHLWKYVPNLKLNKYCSCIIGKKYGWQAVLSFMESVVATVKLPAYLAQLIMTEIRVNVGVLCYLRVEFYFDFSKQYLQANYTNNFFLVSI